MNNCECKATTPLVYGLAMFWSRFHDISLSFVLFVNQIEDRLKHIEDKLDKIYGESDTIDIIECLARVCLQ